MNKTTLRALLDDLLPPSDECQGPDRAQVLALLRSERARHRRQQAGAAMAVLAVLTLWLLLWKSPSRTGPSPVAVTAKQPALVANRVAAYGTPPADAIRRPPAPLVVEHVDDEQLMALLQGTPSALMEWPNGKRTLLVLKR